MSAIPDSLLSAKQVASELGICRTTVYKLVHRGILPAPLAVGGLSKWQRADVEQIKDGPRRLRKPRRPGDAA